ncbi:MAG: 3-keto-5-aminohexanoate cleavage protein [Hoeflea sp.]|uniref:3-keto-5-aminohexanoate cleavage protein n=1 Tax=Hoeflea sp. TaxID=1940281 RepID=UPI003EF1AEA5
MARARLPQIMVAPTGARRGPADHPALPVTIPQIVDEARACFTAGAGAIHAHVRDADGLHTLDAGLYRELLAELEKAVPAMVVQITTEAVGRYTPSEQRALVRELRPVHVSIAMREITAGEDEATSREFYHWAHDAGINVQHILYTPEEVRRLRELVARNVVPVDDLEVIFVLGKYSGARDSMPEDLAAYLAERTGALGQAGFTVCAFGQQETACLVEAVRAGGNARIGFENNLFNEDGKPAATNAARVQELSDRLAQLQRAGGSLQETFKQEPR